LLSQEAPYDQEVTLADNIKPSDEALARARDIGRDVIAAVDRRIVAEQKLDPAFSLHDANWHANAENDYLDAYRLLRSLACPRTEIAG
jgi:hypothetical protein